MISSRHLRRLRVIGASIAPIVLLMMLLSVANVAQGQTNTTSTTTTDAASSNTTITSSSDNATSSSSSSSSIPATSTFLASPNTTAATTTTTGTTTATTTTAAPVNYSSVIFPPMEVRVIPEGFTGKQLRDNEGSMHVLLRGAQWVPPVGSYLYLEPLRLESGQLPLTAPTVPHGQVMARSWWRSPAGIAQSMVPVGGIALANNGATDASSSAPTLVNFSRVFGNISTWAEPENQEDETLDAIVHTALLMREVVCMIEVVSVSEGILRCNGTVDPSTTEKLLFVLPPFLIRSTFASDNDGRDIVETTTQQATRGGGGGGGSNSTTVAPWTTSGSPGAFGWWPVALVAERAPQNTPFTVMVIITPALHSLLFARQVSTGILALVALVAIVVGKEPHIHIMSVARMSLVGRLLECSDEVDLVLHPTQVRLGRGEEKARYFGSLIFNTAITMLLLIGHNVIARMSPKLLPDPPPATQFVIAGALLPGIALAGLKTVTLESSPVQFFLAIVVMLLFVGAWVGCYVVTARDGQFFQRFGRWQHKTDPFFMLRWRVFFTAYTDKRRYYVLIEIIVTLFMAVPSGVSLAEWLTRERSCQYRSIAMLALIGVDFILMLILKPYALKIDKVAYAVSKAFELALAGAALAQAYHSKFALQIGTLLWILGCLFVAGWQAVRAYKKAQYNSDQNEFYLTTADTAEDFTVAQLGENSEHVRATLRGGAGYDDDDDDDDDDGGSPSPGNYRGGGGRKRTALETLLPDSDFHNAGNETALLDEMHMSGSPNELQQRRQKGARRGSWPRNDIQDEDEEEDEVGNHSSGPGSPGNNKSRSSPASARKKTVAFPSMRATAFSPNSPPPPRRKSDGASAAQASSSFSSAIHPAVAAFVNDDDYEMAVMSDAPKVQIKEPRPVPAMHNIGGDQDSYRSASMQEDPLVDYWDALCDTNSPTTAARGIPPSLSLYANSAAARPSADADYVPTNDNYNNYGSGGSSLHLKQNASVGVTPKIAVRDVATPRSISESQPCRLADALEAPTKEGAAQSAAGHLPARFLPAHAGFISHIGKNATVASDGVGIDL